MTAFIAPFAAFRPAFAGTAVSARQTCRARVSMVTSKAIPFMEAPPKLDGSRPGDFGFDPMGLSNNMDQDWMCAAELKNGRVSMLAVVGILVQEFVHLPGAMHAESNPLRAITTAPVEGWIQILLFITIVELVTFKKSFSKEGATYGFDPLGLGKDGKWATAEVINGRLA
eukprot:IDg13163t1